MDFPITVFGDNFNLFCLKNRNVSSKVFFNCVFINGLLMLITEAGPKTLDIFATIYNRPRTEFKTTPGD